MAHTQVWVSPKLRQWPQGVDREGTYKLVGPFFQGNLHLRVGVWGCGWEIPLITSPLHVGSQRGSCSHFPPVQCCWDDDLTVKMLKMLCLGCSHQQLCLAGLSLPLLSSASAFLTYSMELYGKDKSNNTTENSHNSVCSSSADWLCRGCPASRQSSLTRVH